MIFDIPGRPPLDIRHLVFDYNGTLALDGALSEPAAQKLRALGGRYHLWVLTADTYGTAAAACRSLGFPLTVKTFPEGAATGVKAQFVTELGAKICACFGNGYNDRAMLAQAGLAIGVMGPEGISPCILSCADLIVPGIADALDLFLKPRRLIAGLRH